MVLGSLRYPLSVKTPMYSCCFVTGRRKNRLTRFCLGKARIRQIKNLSPNHPHCFQKLIGISMTCFKEVSVRKRLSFVSQLCESYGVYFFKIFTLFQKHELNLAHMNRLLVIFAFFGTIVYLLRLKIWI